MSDRAAPFSPASRTARRPSGDGCWPPPATAGDGNPWVYGMCWLYCRRGAVLVLWIGSVSTPGAVGELYGCGSCIAELDHMVRRQGDRGDGTPVAEWGVGAPARREGSGRPGMGSSAGRVGGERRGLGIR